MTPDMLAITMFSLAAIDKAGKFPLGQVVVTPGIMEKVSPRLGPVCLALHACGDWGEVDHEDAVANDEAVNGGARILSAYCYNENQDKFWIITEADRSSTTMLLPEEY